MLGAGLTPATATRAYRVLYSALAQAVRWQMLSANPATAIRPPRSERGVLAVPTAAQVRAILAASGDDWFHVAVSLSAFTGMRRGEVLALRWEDVDLVAGSIRVTAAIEAQGTTLRFVAPKMSRGRRHIALPDGLPPFLRAWKAEQASHRLLLGEGWEASDLIVERGDGRPVHPDVLSRRFQRLMGRIGMLGVRLHDLRHAYATRLLEAGIHPKVAQEALGHSSAAFTLDRYSHAGPSLQSEAARAIGCSYVKPSPPRRRRPGFLPARLVS